MPKPRAIVVGAGGISNAWFRPLKAEKVDVVAVVDLAAERAEAQVEKYQLKAAVSDNLKRTPRECDADFLVDLTTPDAHCRVTCAANSLATGADRR